jgi:hypothetical protein
MSIRWGRILLAAFLMELVLLAIAIPLNMRGERQIALYVIPPAALIVTYAFTVWLGKGIASKLVLHGALIGVAGTREAGAMAIRACQRAKDCWRRRRRMGPGAPAPGADNLISAADGLKTVVRIPVQDDPD